MLELHNRVAEGRRQEQPRPWGSENYTLIGPLNLRCAVPPPPHTHTQLFNQLLLRPECCSASNLNPRCAAPSPHPTPHTQLFNQLLLRPECCSASNAHSMADGLAQLDAWLRGQAGSEETSYMVALQEDLRHTRQVGGGEGGGEGKLAGTGGRGGR